MLLAILFALITFNAPLLTFILSLSPTILFETPFLHCGIIQCLHETIVHENFNSSHSNGIKCFIIIWINKIKIACHEYGKPILVQRYMLRTMRIKNPHFCALVRWNAMDISFTATIIIWNHVCKIGRTMLFVWIVPFIKLICFYVLWFGHVLPIICFTFVPPMVLTSFYIQSFAWRSFL